MHISFWLFYFLFGLRENLVTHIDPQANLASNISGILLSLFLFYPLVYFILPLLQRKKIIYAIVAFMAWYIIAAAARDYHIKMLIGVYKSEGGWFSGQDFVESFYNSWKDPYHAAELFFSGLAGFLTIVFVPLICKFLRYMYRSNYANALLQKEKTELELSFLKSQLNPHLFFNTLNNLQSFIVHGEKENSIELLGSLADFMRFSLYESDRPLIEIEKESMLIKQYLNIEKVRYADNVSIVYDDRSENTHQMIPPLLLLTLVENAFKHSNELPADEVSITIVLKSNPDKIYFEVSNKVKPALIINEKKGLGHANLKKRLDHFYPDNHLFEIIRNDPFYTARLTIFNR